MAKEVAAAEISKKLAVKALARAAGMGTDPSSNLGGGQHSGDKSASWQLQWDEEFFKHIDDY
eukprot:1244987-Pyramimonas_sp.AAC.1